MPVGSAAGSQASMRPVVGAIMGDDPESRWKPVLSDEVQDCWRFSESGQSDLGQRERLQCSL